MGEVKLSAAELLEEARFQELDRKWKARKEGKVQGYLLVDPNSDFGKSLGLEFTAEELDPNKVRCTFCGVMVDHINATRGPGRLRVIDEYSEVDGVLVRDEKVISSHKQVACPACVMNIDKPVIENSD